jgi:transcriptional regulator with XRE-family HTH domain
MAARKKSRKPRSRGAYELARQGLTDEQVATRLDADRTLVTRWRNGDRAPDVGWRAALLREFGISPEAWSEPVAPPQEEPAPALVDPAPVLPRRPVEQTIDVRSRALRMQRDLDGLLDQLELDTSATPHERAKVLASAATVITALGKLTGEAQDVGESKIVKLPAFRRIVERFLVSLRPWPDAGRAVADSLEEWDG